MEVLYLADTSLGEVVLDQEVTMVDIAPFEVLVKFVESVAFGHLKIGYKRYLFEDLVADFVDFLGDLFFKLLKFLGNLFYCLLQLLVERKLTHFQLIKQRIKIRLTLRLVILFLKLL